MKDNIVLTNYKKKKILHWKYFFYIPCKLKFPQNSFIFYLLSWFCLHCNCVIILTDKFTQKFHDTICSSKNMKLAHKLIIQVYKEILIMRMLFSRWLSFQKTCIIKVISNFYFHNNKIIKILKYLVWNKNKILDLAFSNIY